MLLTKMPAELPSTEQILTENKPFGTLTGQFQQYIYDTIDILKCDFRCPVSQPEKSL